MAKITLEYNASSSLANRIIEIITAMDEVFKIKTHDKVNNTALTRKAIQDVENGNVITCSSYDDYLKRTAEYA